MEKVDRVEIVSAQRQAPRQVDWRARQLSDKCLDGPKEWREEQDAAGKTDPYMAAESHAWQFVGMRTTCSRGGRGAGGRVQDADSKVAEYFTVLRI